MTTKPKAPRYGESPRFISYPDLRQRYGESRSRTQLRRNIAAGLYPPPKQISAGRIAWETRELDAHYDNVPTVSYADAVA
jgi:predicted DNA-binding transcriptional regulator AlpA